MEMELKIERQQRNKEADHPERAAAAAAADEKKIIFKALKALT